MKTLDISGFSGGYEDACQVMLTRALGWYVKKQKHPRYKTLENVMGICTAENPDAKELDKVMCKGIDPSGAMHQCVVAHFFHILANGYDDWISDEVWSKKYNDTRVYEIKDEKREKAIKTLKVIKK